VRTKLGLYPSQVSTDVLGAVPGGVVRTAAAAAVSSTRVVSDMGGRPLVDGNVRVNPGLDHSIAPAEDPRALGVDPDQRERCGIGDGSAIDVTVHQYAPFESANDPERSSPPVPWGPL
jgi:hypothetical protein